MSYAGMHSHINLPIRLSSKDSARFWNKVELPASPGECWMWTGAAVSSGYGVFSLGGKVVRAHRLSYALRHGEIPDTLVLDHIKGRCSSTLCINPDHLEAVTQRENVRRGDHYKGPEGPCRHGHEANWTVRRRVRKNGDVAYCRECKTCKSVAAAEKYRLTGKR